MKNDEIKNEVYFDCTYVNFVDLNKYYIFSIYPFYICKLILLIKNLHCFHSLPYICYFFFLAFFAGIYEHEVLMIVNLKIRKFPELNFKTNLSKRKEELLITNILNIWNIFGEKLFCCNLWAKQTHREHWLLDGRALLWVTLLWTKVCIDNVSRIRSFISQ